ncbi:hypothetical protein A3E39_04210 [Candidatus Uhrbacteria bacterium RIFCSPHIGHO2_12_FULL_60_25]|uniref:Uncharacterized protein n=1 Tax=Candidatus Uhrbacteria bacterium RIFCSPHIGHO2_12_FULL_60_25 TaxID=1802399 RepID=A0A1F7UN52_9BACT|nr:MAG: hypothetical protein A3E39_04210 [Candidatus Uhrbacteria bacterium RIFCSPHIGHO2_12_FULL_60_25]
MRCSRVPINTLGLKPSPPELDASDVDGNAGFPTRVLSWLIVRFYLLTADQRLTGREEVPL